MTDACSTGTATVRCGRASATASDATAQREQRGGDAAAPGRRRCASTRGDVAGAREADGEAAPPAPLRRPAAATPSGTSEERPAGRSGAAKLIAGPAPRSRSQSRSVRSTTCSAPARRSVLAHALAALGLGAAKASRSVGELRVGLDLAAGLGVDEHDWPASGSSRLARVDDLDGDDACGARRARAAALPSRRVAEVRDDHDQARASRQAPHARQRVRVQAVRRGRRRRGDAACTSARATAPARRARRAAAAAATGSRRQATTADAPAAPDARAATTTARRPRRRRS